MLDFSFSRRNVTYHLCQNFQSNLLIVTLAVKYIQNLQNSVLFQLKSTIVVKELSVTTGLLGRREITFQLYSLKDYIRIETVAGPPAKLKFIDLDPEQVCH